MAYVRPRFDAPVDLDAHLRALPPTGTTRGMYFSNVIAVAKRHAPRVDVVHEAGLTRASYVSFARYPAADYLKLAVVAAKHAWPDAPVGEGLRRLGHQAYDTFLGSHVGKVVFGAFAGAFNMIAKHGDKGWGLSMDFGHVSVEEFGPRHYRYHFTELPVFLETHQVGAVEGAMRATGVKGEVLVDAKDISTLSMDLAWTE